MNSRHFAPAVAFSLGALVVLVVEWFCPVAQVEPLVDDRVWEAAVLFVRMEAECSPDSIANDYSWSSNAPPTEKHRRELLEQFHRLGNIVLDEVQGRLKHRRDDEFGEMLVVMAAGLGDDAMTLPAAKLMAYSRHPAVRLCAARELRALRDPRTVEWFEYAAQNDERCVRNDCCGRSAPELFYPVRATAQLALKEMGIETKTGIQLPPRGELGASAAQ